MIGNIKQFILTNLYRLLWCCIYYVYRLQLEIRDLALYMWKILVQRLLSCLPLYSQYAHLANLAKATSTFSKLPKHIAISVVEKEPETILSRILSYVKLNTPSKPSGGKSIETENRRNEIDLQSLAKVISWAWASHIPQISLYDFHGRLKEHYRELGCLVQEEIIQNFWALKEYSEFSDPPGVKFHNISKQNGFSNGVNGMNSPPPLHIGIFSNDDGKAAIVRAARDIALEDTDESIVGLEVKCDTKNHIYSSNYKKRQMYESKIDTILNRVHNWPKGVCSTEPDLLVILSNIKSTLGFLPWHIRLTEIHWLPTLERIQIQDFQEVVWKFARCQQRFGT